MAISLLHCSFGPCVTSGPSAHHHNDATRCSKQNGAQVLSFQPLKKHRPLKACCRPLNTVRHCVLAAASTLDAQPSAATQTDGEKETAPGSGVYEGFWQWQGHTVRYQRCGDSGPPLLCVHGFGGNCDHWRKNLPELGKKNRAFAIDLLGYGYSSKPDPREVSDRRLYSFETWGEQILDFIAEKMGDEQTFLVSNSVGGLAALEAAIAKPQQVPAVFITNISLRKLHAKNQSSFQRPFVAALQRVLRETQIGELFFQNVAQPRTVKSILQQCYGDKRAVTDELVEKILQPGLQPGATRVFLDFLSYSDGPLPEEQLAAVKVPVTMLWGAADPWEKVEWGRELKSHASVVEYHELPGVGHCPMDEAPHLVNPLIQKFVDRHTANLAGVAAAT